MNEKLHTIAPQAILINHWKLYFENGQTRRIKNLAYTLTPVDHDPITRKELMRQAGGHTALVLFYELLSLAATCPQRGLLVNASGVLTAESIAAITGLSLEDVNTGLARLKEAAWISYVLCPKRLIVSGSLRTGRRGRPKQPEVVEVSGTSEDAPDLHIEWEYAIVDKGNGPETERRLPEAIARLLKSEPEGVDVSIKHLQLAARTVEKRVACHAQPKCQEETHTVACHTEAVDVEGKKMFASEPSNPQVPARPIHKAKAQNHRPFYHGIPQKGKKR